MLGRENTKKYVEDKETCRKYKGILNKEVGHVHRIILIFKKGNVMNERKISIDLPLYLGFEA